MLLAEWQMPMRLTVTRAYLLDPAEADVRPAAATASNSYYMGKARL